MWMQFLTGLLGLVAGFGVVSGTVAFLISIGNIPRYAGITKTANRVPLYEDACVLGIVLGNLAYLCQMRIPFGMMGSGIFGLMAGFCVGGWIVALGEVVDIYAIVARRIGLTRGVSWIILFMAAGKSLGSILYFYWRWGTA